MDLRISLLAASLLVGWSGVALGAQYERSGDWVYHSKAFAEDGETTWDACVASTESLDGPEWMLRREPAESGGFHAAMSLGNEDWALGQEAVRVRLDIGADRWVLPGQGEGSDVTVSWTADSALLILLEDFASSSFAVLTGRDGARVAQFSLRGSRKAIEAMKACVEAQIGRGLGDVFEAEATSTNPF
jgi:hypothetical protein